MNNTILHIGLQVSEADLIDFYVEVMGGKIENSFLLSFVDAALIFGLEEDINAYFIRAEELVFELFVRNDVLIPSCSHVCFFSENAHEIAARALEKGYPLYVRKKYEKETYFIKDSSNNLFEIKS